MSSTTTQLSCSGSITSATLDISGSVPVLTITINQAVRDLSSTNALLVFTKQGYIIPGAGEAWGSPPFNLVAMGAYTADNGMCWAIYNQRGALDVNPGTYQINMAASLNLDIANVTFGNPGTYAPGSIDESASILGTTGNGPLTFTVANGPITLVDDTTSSAKSQPLLLTLRNAGCSTGASQCWGGNIGTTLKIVDTLNAGYSNSSSPSPSSSYYQYQLLPDSPNKLVILTPGIYQTCISAKGGAQLLNLTTRSYTPPAAPVVPHSNPKYTGTMPLQVGYIQLSGEHPVSAATMPPQGLASCNIVVLAFAGTDNSSGTPTYIDSPPKNPMNYYDECKYIGGLAAGTAEIFYSVGGANITNATIKPDAVDKIVDAVDKQAKALSGYFSQKITGIDLDLEGGWPDPKGAIESKTIAGLIDGFKSKGYKVSLAPQIVSTNGKNIDSSNPSINLGLASGGVSSHQYNDAIRLAKNPPDYIFVQCYNTGGFTIDDLPESDPRIFTAACKALNNLVSTPYDKTSAPMSINKASGVKIAIGFPANGGAGNEDTLFKPKLFTGAPVADYGQLAILNSLKTQMESQTWDQSVQGIMMWSLNNDYMPKWFQDNYATTGGFCQEIFNAQEVPPQPSVPYMTLQLNYGAPSGFKGGMILTVITPDKEYLIFGTPDGNGGCRPMVTSDRPALWTTITPISEGLMVDSVVSMYNVAESGSLDVIASAAPPAGYDCTLMVSLYADGEKNPTAAPRMQSQALPVTLYGNADNVLTIAVYNDNNDELPGWPYRDTYNPAKNGNFILSVRNQAGSGTQEPSSTGDEFWWSTNVPNLGPAWLGRVMNVFANLAIDMGLKAIGGQMLPILIKTAEAASGVKLEFTAPDGK